MWLCCTVQLLCCTACWTLRPGELCLSPRQILLSVCLLEPELFCTWLIHFAGAGRPWAFLLDTIYCKQPWGGKRVCEQLSWAGRALQGAQAALRGAGCSGLCRYER